MKRLLNRSEEETNSVLRNVTETWGAHTFPKVRVADVLPIENSGISNDLYRFALRSHFDFLVTDDDLQPLFVVEFDGETHSSEIQRGRDAQKDLLCERFQFPLLRINSRYIHKRYRQMDLLSWFVNYWFAQRVIDQAEESGELPPYEGVGPTALASLPGTSERFPLWLDADVRVAFRRYHEQGKCIDLEPSIFVGAENNGTFRAIAYMAVSDSSGLFAEAAMHAQRFNVPYAEVDVVEALAVHQIHENFMNVTAGVSKCVSLDFVCDRVDWYGNRCERVAGRFLTQSNRLRAASPQLFG